MKIASQYLEQSETRVIWCGFQDQKKTPAIIDGLDAASAAFEVGYESATQLDREYSRLFGQPPMRDIRTLRSPGALPLESVSSQ